MRQGLSPAFWRRSIGIPDWPHQCRGTLFIILDHRSCHAALCNDTFRPAVQFFVSIVFTYTKWNKKRKKAKFVPVRSGRQCNKAAPFPKWKTLRSASLWARTALATTWLSRVPKIHKSLVKGLITILEPSNFYRPITQHPGTWSNLVCFMHTSEKFHSPNLKPLSILLLNQSAKCGQWRNLRGGRERRPERQLLSISVTLHTDFFATRVRCAQTGHDFIRIEQWYNVTFQN